MRRPAPLALLLGALLLCPALAPGLLQAAAFPSLQAGKASFSGTGLAPGPLPALESIEPGPSAQEGGPAGLPGRRLRCGFFGSPSGGPQGAGPSLLELILLAAALVIFFRFIRSRGGKKPPRPKTGQDEEGYDRRPYEDLWDRLRSEKTRGSGSPGKPNLEPDPEESEFIQGAKATFTRLTEAWDDRDLEDIARFTTPEMLASFQERAQREPEGETTEILLLNARLLGVRQEEAREVASVSFDALVHRGSGSRPENIRQVWEFVRDSGQEDATWLLASLEDVESEPVQ